jgi:hypothetical protein
MKTAFFLAVLALGGCGGSGSGDGGDPPAMMGAVTAAEPARQGAAPAAVADAAFSAARALLGRDADGEPAAVDGMALPADRPEPLALD